MIGKTFPKPIPASQIQEYEATADWCNKNNAKVVEYPDSYVVVSIPEATADEKAAQFTMLIDAALDSFAKEKGYKDIDGLLCKAVTNWNSDAQQGVAAYNATWDYVLRTIPQVKSGAISPIEAMRNRPSLHWE